MSNDVGTLYIVATPIGNLGDITLRAIEVLRSVDGILAEDSRHSRRLLDHLAIRRPLTALHEHNERVALERVVQRLQSGESLALISDAGTPLISDPGFPLVRSCRALDIPVAAVPGVSAVITALTVSGLPTDRFRFEGFLPRKSSARREWLQGLLRETATLVFYESAHRVVETLHDMREVFGGEREAVLARELTKRHETVRSLPLSELLEWVEKDEDQRKGEFVLLIAGAVDTDDEEWDTDHLLRALLEDLSVKQAAALAARITGGKKNALYQRALTLAAE